MRANRVLKLAVAYTLATASSMAMAQTPPAATATPDQLETVIVTGSYIRGSAEDAALPVDVITADDLAKQGSPSTLEILKQMPVSAGVLGDSNQFDARAQGSEGSGSVNLRGLGPQRTLLLMNGRRMVNSPFTGAPDTNLLPTSAIGRLEVLKDGAAATYGSDAIAGVVNFITKTGKTSQGLEVSADYKAIKGSDGDYTAAATFGWASDAIDFLVSGGYEHRSELLAHDRSWAVRPYMENPQGGWSAAGNPATFVPTSALGSPIAGSFRDPQCMPLGGFNGFVQDQVSNAITPVCNWQYTQFDALTEKEDRYQVYGEVNVEFTDSLKLHVEGLYAATEIPIYRTSPSYAALQAPSTVANGGTSIFTGTTNRYFVPSTNPGFIAFNAANPTAGLAAAGGAWVVAYRPFAIGGNPLFNYGSSEGPRSYDAMRFSADVKGSIGSLMDFDVAATYMKQSNDREGRDTVVNRAELALRGLGGPNCNITTGTPGVGACSWLNPFSTAIPANAVSGVPNGQFLTNGVPNNNLEMINWMFPTVSTTQSNELLVFDAVVNGEIGFFSLPGGNIGWAAGAQYRDTAFESEYSDLNNYAVTPCVNSVMTGIVGPSACTQAERDAPGGALMFLGGGTNTSLSQHVYGVFGEVSLPITDSLQAQVAVRYEDYGGSVGDTVDPKLAVKWTLTDAFALRGSVGTTFRGPTANNINSGSVTSLQSVRGTFRAIRTSGNPDLSPESAFNFNVGMLLNSGPVSASLDYWSFSFKDQIVNEPVAGIVDTVFPLGGAPQCSSPLAARFTFNGTCSVSNVTRLDIKVINGPDLDTSGVDMSLNLDLGAGLELGVNATYVLEYQSGALAIDGVENVQKAFDAAGLLNYQTTAYPLPQFKGTFFAQYSKGDNSFRWQVNYVDSYTDQRTDIFEPSAATNIGGAGSNLGSAYLPVNNVPVTGGKKIGSTTLHSLYYNLQLPADVTLSFALENIFDTAPSFARLDYSYDPFTGSAFGRTAKLGVKAKF